MTQRNRLSSNATGNVKTVTSKLSKLPYYNLPAVAIMEIAHDLHLCGSAQENILAEHMIAGVAKGLMVSSDASRFPVCPLCGKRHPQHF